MPIKITNSYGPRHDPSRGRFDLIGVEQRLGVPPEWHPVAVSTLWLFHLHYLEWLEELTSTSNSTDFDMLWASWHASTKFGANPEWSPYVASVRVWVLCMAAQRAALGGPGHRAELASDIALHGRFVNASLEVDVGGNHLVKNLKGVVGCGVFLGDDRLVRAASEMLQRELNDQGLPDGAHFELSPSYHAQVLADFIDIENLLSADDRPPVPGLHERIEAMRDWLSDMVLPDGEVPMFNDCTRVGSERLAALGLRDAADSHLVVKEASGYVIAKPDSRLHFVLDIGRPCPPELPAHAHADCLSFEMCVDGRRVIVDPGTSTYEPGDRRMWERGTPAHNTVAIDGENQTEVWATFRAARLAKPLLERADDDAEVITVIGSHNGYERLRGKPRHRRTWEMREGTVVIKDEVTGKGTHLMSARLQLAPGIDAAMTTDGAVKAGPIRVTFDAPHESTVVVRPSDHEPGGVAFDFGEVQPAAAIDFELQASLPVSWVTTIEVVGDLA